MAVAKLENIFTNREGEMREKRFCMLFNEHIFHRDGEWRCCLGERQEILKLGRGRERLHVRGEYSREAHVSMVCCSRQCLAAVESQARSGFFLLSHLPPWSNCCQKWRKGTMFAYKHIEHSIRIYMLLKMRYGERRGEEKAHREKERKKKHGGRQAQVQRRKSVREYI